MINSNPSTTSIAAHTAEALFLSQLKNDTAALHRKLEQTPVTATLMSPALEKEHYIQYLAAMREVIAWTEKNVFPVIAPIIDDVESRRKLSAIDNDLSGLQADNHHFSHEFNPSPSSNTSASMLGFMYVVEGSSLGGMVILKQIQQRNFINAGTISFLSIYGKDTGRYWKKFISNLSSYVVKNHIETDVIRGAQQAFNAIDDYFRSLTK